MVYDSGPAVEWLTSSFGLDLSLVSRLGGKNNIYITRPFTSKNT